MHRLGLSASTVLFLLALASGCSGSQQTCEERCAASGNANCTCENLIRGPFPLVEQPCDGSSNSCPANQTCLEGEDFPKGACGAACSNASDCLTGSVCEALSMGNYCLRSCTSDGDCVSGYSCLAFGDGQHACVSAPAAVDNSTACTGTPNIRVAPAVTMTEPAGCQTPIGTSTLSGARVQDLGDATVGTRLQFTVPANTASFTIIEQGITVYRSLEYQGQPIDNVAVPDQLKNPSGALIYDDINGEPNKTPAQMHAFYSGGGETTGTFTYPNTTAGLAAGVAAGTWSFTVNDYAYECLSISQCTTSSNTGKYHVTVIFKQGPVGTSGNLDVGIYLVSSKLRPASSAATNADMVRTVNRMAKFFAQAGVCIQNVDLYDVPSWAVSKYATAINPNQADACSDLNQMFTLSAASTDGLNVFFVDDLTVASSGGNSGGVIVGIDGTIPGPSTVGGTVKSGAVVNSGALGEEATSGACQKDFNLDCGDDEVAYIAAHESGHWLGLYHTSEGLGDQFDPIADTASCKCDVCLSGSSRGNCDTINQNVTSSSVSYVQTKNCVQNNAVCGGGDNLMYWFLDETLSSGHLTAQQGQVMLSNPAVQ